jgi:hypothetical protein
MSLQKATSSGRNREAISPDSTTSSNPLYLPQKIMPAWEHTLSILTNSVAHLIDMEEKLKVVDSTVMKLPDTNTRDKLITQHLTLHKMVAVEIRARSKEANMSKMCLQAFGDTNRLPVGSGGDYLELFVQVLNSAPQDMTVSELQTAFATNVASSKVYKKAERRVKKANTHTRGAVPSSAPPAGEDRKQTQARRPPKTNHAASTPGKPLKDTTNLKPNPKEQSIANPDLGKQGTKPATSVYTQQPNKIRTVTKNPLLSQKKTPLMKKTEPSRTTSKSEENKATVEHAPEEALCLPEAHSTAQHVGKGDKPMSEADVRHLRIGSNKQSEEHSAAQLKVAGPVVPADVAKPDGDVDSEKGLVAADAKAASASELAASLDERKDISPVDTTCVVVKKHYIGKKKVQDKKTVGDDEVAAPEKSTGGASTPRDHTREHDSKSGTKRKRFIGDDGPLSAKKIALEGRYIARPKVCFPLVAILVNVLT